MSFVMNLSSQSYYQGSVDSLSLNLGDLKRIKQIVKDGYNEIAIQDLERLIESFEKTLNERNTKIKTLKKELKKT
jgi:hypothetical protein